MQGKTINGYTLQHQLGVGGMAEVWYAENAIEKQAAVKLLLPKFCNDEAIVARFQNEAKVMVKLDHPNIRQVYDYGSIDGRPCIVMEYLEGDDLKAMMKKGYCFSDEELVKWWNQMVEALNYTHSIGIVHRDIKPSNIFIDKLGYVRLMDFGIAKNNEGGSGTMTGSTLGTRIYMSPEQVKDPKRVDYRTDLYSLAVTFVHLLSGKAPYDSTTSSDFEIQVSIVTKPLELSEIPMDWRTFLEPYLEKDPDKRPKLTAYTVMENENPETAQEEEEVAEEEWGEETVVGDTPFYPMEEVHENDVKETFEQEQHVGEQVFHVNDVAFAMKSVAGGEFSMGSVTDDSSDAESDELPVHKVKLSSFLMAETPVTKALWKAVMGGDASVKGEDGDLPVTDVTWFQTQEFIAKLNAITGRRFRLPTEAEWEYAARGGKKQQGRKYAGSDSIGKVAWYRDNYKGQVHPVKQKDHNELGLYDMSGNVWEWCNDWYGDDYYRNSPSFNPQGPSSGIHRVMRGGSWFNPKGHCTVSFRNYDSPDIHDEFSGFRLALSE